MKILVLRFSSIGDIVLTTPVLRCLKTQLPDAEIHFLTKKKFFSLVEHNPYVDKIFTFENDLSGVIQELKKEKYDHIIDLHHNLRSLRIKTALKVPCHSFDKLNFKKWALVNLKWDFLPSIHIVDRYLETVASLQVKDDGKGLDFFPCDCDLPDSSEIPEAFKNGPYAVASIGGTHFTKKMPAIKWSFLINQLEIPVVLVGGKEDKKAAEEIMVGCPKKKNLIWNACGQFSIGGSAHLIKQSQLVITHDTGMMHIAAAFQKPIVAIWGNTTPRFGMEPFRTPHFNLEVNDLSCRPCSKIGFSDCPKGHFKCMNDQWLENPALWAFIQESISPTIPNAG